MNDREPFEEKFGELLQREAAGIDTRFEPLWERAENEAARLSDLRRKRLLLGLVGCLAVSVGIGFFAGRAGPPGEAPLQSHFCARDAVDDWCSMMQSDFYRGFPSDQFLNP